MLDALERALENHHAAVLGIVARDDGARLAERYGSQGLGVRVARLEVVHEGQAAGQVQAVIVRVRPQGRIQGGQGPFGMGHVHEDPGQLESDRGVVGRPQQTRLQLRHPVAGRGALGQGRLHLDVRPRHQDGDREQGEDGQVEDATNHGPTRTADRGPGPGAESRHLSQAAVPNNPGLGKNATPAPWRAFRIGGIYRLDRLSPVWHSKCTSNLRTQPGCGNWRRGKPSLSSPNRFSASRGRC